MRVLLAGHTPIGGDFVVGSHHLARVWALAGHDVLHLASAVTPFHAVLARRPDQRRRLVAALGGVRTIRPGLRQLVPLSLVPGSLARFVPGRRDPVAAATLPSLRRRLRRLEFDRVDLLLVDDPWLLGACDLVDARRSIYRPTDLYRFTTGSHTLHLQKSILARCDGLVATSLPVRDEVLALADRTLPAIVLENGADIEHMSTERPAPLEYARLPAPRFVYVGALDARFDWGAVSRAAARLPDASFVLIGPLPVAGPPSMPPNVHVLGSRPYARIPAYLQHASAGLLPLGDHPANPGRSPMKLYEYLAAGLPVVARATSELERRGTPHVHLYRTGDALGDTLASVLATSPTPGDCRSAAAGHDWIDIAGRILEFAERLPSTARRLTSPGGPGARRD